MKYYKVITEQGWDGVYEIDKIYPGDLKSYGTTVEEDADAYPGDFKKVTKAAYNKQEGIVPKPRVKKVVKFKVGDYVEVIDPGSSCNKKGDFGYITEICIKDNDCRVSKTNDPYEIRNWVSFTGIKLSTQTKLKQTEMENYSIEGSKALKTAFVEECKLKTYNSSTLDHIILTSESMPLGTIQGGRRATQHFVLPRDWDKAVKYVTEFNAIPKFKNGDYVVVIKNTSFSCNKVGDVGIVSGLDKNSCHVTVVPTSRGYGNAHCLVDLRLATPAEIKKATTPVFKVGDWVYDESSSSLAIGKLTEVTPNKVKADMWYSKTGIEGNGGQCDKKGLRLATAEEIKRIVGIIELKFKMAGYDSKINKSAKTISFGCQTYTKAEVKLLLDAAKLCERVGYSAKVKASGFVVNETDILTPDSLTKILAQLK